MQIQTMVIMATKNKKYERKEIRKDNWQHCQRQTDIFYNCKYRNQRSNKRSNKATCLQIIKLSLNNNKLWTVLNVEPQWFKQSNAGNATTVIAL